MIEGLIVKIVEIHEITQENNVMLRMLLNDDNSPANIHRMVEAGRIKDRR